MVETISMRYVWKVILVLLFTSLEIALINGSLLIPYNPPVGNCSANMTALPTTRIDTESSAGRIEKALSVVLASDFVRQIQQKGMHNRAREKCSSLNGTYIKGSGQCMRMRIVNNGTTPCEALRVYDYIFLLDVTEKQSAEYWLFITGNTLSLVSSAVLLITYITNRELQTSYGRCIVFLSVNTMFQQVMQILSLYAENSINYCTAVAILHHWSYLAMFLWMASVAFEFATTFTHLRRPTKELQRHRFRIYALVSEGIPTAVVSLCIMVDFTSHKTYIGYGEKNVCFISNYIANVVVFSLPIGCIIIFNIICLGTALVFIVKTQYSSVLHLQTSRKRSRITVIILTLKLSLLLGIGWAFGPIARLTHNESVLFIYIFFNTFQGSFIFGAFCANHRVLRFYKQTIHATVVRLSTSQHTEHERNTDHEHETAL